MRNKLAPYYGSYVQCKGWIKYWKDIDDKKPQRRVLVSQPTIREPNRNVPFDKLPIISTEHHLNLYIDQEDLEDYDNDFQLNNQITFTGIIQGYLRSDGSFDYGVYPTKQSLLHEKLEQVNILFGYMADEYGIYSENFYQFNLITRARLDYLSDELESAGDQLPTFKHTYKWYRKEIDAWLEVSNLAIKHIKNACSNRAMRRRNKIKRNFANQHRGFI